MNNPSKLFTPTTSSKLMPRSQEQARILRAQDERVRRDSQIAIDYRQRKTGMRKLGDAGIIARHLLAHDDVMPHNSKRYIANELVEEQIKSKVVLKIVLRDMSFLSQLAKGQHGFSPQHRGLGSRTDGYFIELLVVHTCADKTMKALGSTRVGSGAEGIGLPDEAGYASLIRQNGQLEG
ncbi:hypothetical protein KCU83_g411, partial [Aureobasidium melanogenum]